jgi:UDP-glucose 4-epimerase
MTTDGVIVTGAAGYIGSHMMQALLSEQECCTALDSLHRGHSAAVPPGGAFDCCDVGDPVLMAPLLWKHGVSTVLHFAGLAYVGESFERPVDYYDQNCGVTLRLVQAMREAGVTRLVYSSSCATYGVPESLPITEETPQRPVSPYGRSKYFAEQMLQDAVRAWPELGVVALRYFNVAGCARDGSLGEDHRPETHIIPLLLKTALGQRDAFTILGDDYSTPDGTCIRDYVHVEDLCKAHLLAMDAIRPGEFQAYNVGLGRGYSVREVIASVERVTGCEIPVRVEPRRPGDPPELICSAEKIRRELGWEPEITELDEIVTTAWNWCRAHPHGYES